MFVELLVLACALLPWIGLFMFLWDIKHERNGL